MVQEIEHPTLGTIQQLGPVAKFSKTPADLRAAPPLLGEHTESILRDEVGYRDSNIAQLRADGII
jgi:formyl-CoA transferase